MYWQHFNRKHTVYLWLSAIFLSSLLLANLIGAYLFEIRLPFTLPLVGNRALLSAGIIPFPVTFLLTDLLNEYYGKQGARFITYIGLAMSILLFLYLSIGEHLAVALETVISADQYQAISSNYSGMFIASLSAYLISQLLDINIFQAFRHLTGNKLLWLRATGSTVLSQIFDSLIVTVIAFYDNLPLEKILLIAASNYVWKFIIAVGITPFLYVGHLWLKKLLSDETETEKLNGQ